MVLSTLQQQENVSVETNTRLTFINELVKETQDRVLIRDQILNVLNAANDGAAIVISHVLFLLSRYPKIQEALRNEMDSAAGGEQPTYETLKNMRYLRCVINESRSTI